MQACCWEIILLISPPSPPPETSGYHSLCFSLPVAYKQLVNWRINSSFIGSYVKKIFFSRQGEFE